MPNNEAFEKRADGKFVELLMPENRDQLVELLKHHVVKEKVSAESRSQTSEITTASGKNAVVAMNGQELILDDANVIKADVACQNGLIHAVDTILQRLWAKKQCPTVFTAGLC